MKNVNQLLQHIEIKIPNQEEHGYFLTHSIRYEYLLSHIATLAKEKKLTILDIGCFPYHMGRALELMGHMVYGIASEHEKVTQKNVSTLNIEKDSFPYKDNFFDIILFSEVLEHLPQSPVFPLIEMHRVTKKGGLVIISTPNIARSINRVKLLFGKSIMYPLDVYFDEGGRGNLIYHRHNREYTLSELTTLLHRTKWEIEHGGYFISYTPFRKRLIADSFLLKTVKMANYLTMLPIPSLQDTLFVVGRK